MACCFVSVLAVFLPDILGVPQNGCCFEIPTAPFKKKHIQLMLLVFAGRLGGFFFLGLLFGWVFCFWLKPDTVIRNCR